jgi:Bacterial regulatory proteins, luxR family
VALSQIITGASSKEAGRSLGVSPRTVEFHRANIMQKLGAKNTVDLVHAGGVSIGQGACRMPFAPSNVVMARTC